MTKSKGIDSTVQVASSIQNAIAILAKRVTERGGDLTGALVHLGKGEVRYENSLNLIADELAAISRVLKTPKKTSGVFAPEGGRLYLVHIPDQLDGWDAAISAGFPDTPLSHDVRRVGSAYPPYRSTSSIEREIILVNFNRSIKDVKVVLAWGEKNGLIPASPRLIWAIGIHWPLLPRTLGQRSLILASLEEGALSVRGYVPCGLWDRGKREARLVSFCMNWDSNSWFAFEKQTQPD
ncbi:MAG: hypothetical protein NTV60_01860 [Candidatus Kaiserbacteria bacterium]|nr:hypothetical protein [Candidatus Kaiserbacteria bacterium]